MRLIGGHDYYDSALAIAGRDEGITFVRSAPRLVKAADMGLKLALEDHDRRRGSSGIVEDSLGVRFTVVTIVVGERRFDCVRADWREATPPYGRSSVFFEGDRLFAMARRNATASIANLEYIRPHLFKNEPLSPGEISAMVRNRATTAIYDPSRWNRGETDSGTWLVDSPDLKDYELGRVFDAFTCFQTISMWIGGVMPQNANAMVEIDDRTKIAKHGFDAQSFRRAKQPKRGRRSA